jgi:acylphosphatase
MMKKAIRARISGRVQGVGFRYFAQREATQLGLTGFVKNRFDGRVEVFAQGESNLVDHFLEILEQGPRFGKVESLYCEESKMIDKYKSFNIEY